MRWLQLRSLPKPPMQFFTLFSLLFFLPPLPSVGYEARKGGEGEMLEYRMPLSSYLNSKADIAAALVNLPDPEARRKTNADNSTAGSNLIISLLLN